MSTAALVDSGFLAAMFPNMATKQPSKKAKITAEHLAESKFLKRLWDAYQAKENALKQGAFGNEFGIGNQQAVSNMLNGNQPISLKAAKGFAVGLGCKVGDFSPRLAGKIDGLAAANASGWPFPGIPRAEFDRLSADQKIEIQGLVRRAIKDFAEQKSVGAAPVPK